MQPEIPVGQEAASNYLDFDEDRVNDHLEVSSLRRKAELLRYAYVRRQSSAEKMAEARRVLAAFQGIFRSLRKREMEIENLEYVYGKFDAALRFHLQANYVGLTQSLDKQHERDVDDAVCEFEEYVLQRKEPGKLRGVISRDPRGNAQPGASHEDEPQIKNNDQIGHTMSKRGNKWSVFGPV